MTIADELSRLESLRRNGSLTEIEFAEAKRKVLAANNGGPQMNFRGGVDNLFGFDEKTWCTLMHASQLLVFAGGLGIVVPIVMYVISKDKSPMAAEHGARIMNWIISSFIFTLIALVLSFFLIGIPLLFVIAAVELVYPILGALKASDGKLFGYPGALPIIRA